MKTVIINGQSHKGSTYHTARLLAEKIGGEITEFFLPDDFGEFCTGCTNCFQESEEKCPHYNQLNPITTAMLDADVIILASPVYVYHSTGAMKAFLDHYGYIWMVHRPEEKMFSKQAVCISTAVGAGMKSAIKDMNHSLFFWGISKRHKIGLAVAETRYSHLSESVLEKMEEETSSVAKKIKRNSGKVRVSLPIRFLFFAMHLAQREGFNEADKNYWHEKGWTGKKRPWKNKESSSL